jgi:hypothetical protein
VVALCGAVIVALAIVRYLGSVGSTQFNAHDDLQGYFVFPVKMLATGSLGSDPFSERRLMTSLGGQSFLQTFLLAARGVESLHMLDLGIGTVVLLSLVVGLGGRLGLSARAQVLVLLGLLLMPVPTANITATLTASALLLALISTATMTPIHESGLRGKLTAMGLLAGAACSMKSQIIPSVGLVTALCFAIETIRSPSRMRTAAWCLAAGLLAAAIDLPWMVSMYQSSGTPLYPLLGKGYHASVYGEFAGPSSAIQAASAVRSLMITASNALFVAFALLALEVASVRRRGVLTDPIAGVALGTIGGALATALASGGFSPERYTFSILLAGVMAVLCHALALPRTASFAGASPAVAASLVGAALIGSGWNESRLMYQGFGKEIRNAIRNTRIASRDDRERIASAQASLPEGATVLERVTQPFLFDFARNRILIADYPGAASPPPGMPAFRGEEALAAYLLSQSIRYVVYSYANEAAFTRTLYGERLGPEQHPWIRSEARHTFDFQDNLLRLRDSRTRLYDDGEIVVMDLSSRAQGSAEPSSRSGP